MNIDWSTTWTMIAGIGTTVVAIGAVITGIYVRRNWNRALEKDRQREIKSIFNNFLKLEGPLYFKIFANETISNNMKMGKFYMLFGLDKRKKAPYAIMKFLSNLGKSLKRNEISIEEVYIYFEEYLLKKDLVLLFFRNFTYLFPALPGGFIDNINYLINEIGKKYRIKEYHDVVKTSYIRTSSKDFLKQLDNLGLEI